MKEMWRENMNENEIREKIIEVLKKLKTKEERLKELKNKTMGENSGDLGILWEFKKNNSERKEGEKEERKEEKKKIKEDIIKFELHSIDSEEFLNVGEEEELEMELEEFLNVGEEEELKELEMELELLYELEIESEIRQFRRIENVLEKSGIYKMEKKKFGEKRKILGMEEWMQRLSECNI
ncbi:hypothetical protein ACEYW6_30910 [Nostoc sp. UIC 10607]|uniref:hypothetical protein n=1 Tax=Nostoc sp. UIC 10607 TaxID=3045935 RepID=UPI00399F822A